MNCEIGAFSCPMMYCMAIIMPSVMSPSMTALAARKEMTTFLVLVDEHAADLLCLSERQALDRHAEHAGPVCAPTPSALLLLAVVELYVLHAADELHDVALIVGRLLETRRM